MMFFSNPASNSAIISIMITCRFSNSITEAKSGRPSLCPKGASTSTRRLSFSLHQQ